MIRRRHARQRLVHEDAPVQPFHHIEGRADDREVVAINVGFWNRDVGALQGADDPVFAVNRMGVVLIARVSHMPVMVIATVLGAFLGELIRIEDGLALVGGLAKRLVEKVATTPRGISHDTFIESFVAILVLFCASGAGIFGALNEGMTEFTGVMLFTSHDHQVTQTVANRIMEILPNGVIDKREAYDEYIENEDVKKMRELWS